MNKRWLLATLFSALVLAAGSALASSSLLTATVRPNPLFVTIDAPANVLIGQWFEVSADVLNRGGDAIERSRTTLHAPRDVQVKRKQKRIGDLTAGETTTITWQARARNSSTFILLVEATGNLSSEEISASDSAVVSATDSFALTVFKQLFKY